MHHSHCYVISNLSDLLWGPVSLPTWNWSHQTTCRWKVEGWNRFSWGNAFLFSLLKFLFPNYSIPAFVLCVGTGKQQQQNPQTIELIITTVKTVLWIVAAIALVVNLIQIVIWIVVIMIPGNDTLVCWKFKELHSQLSQRSRKPEKRKPEALGRTEPRAGIWEKGNRENLFRVAERVLKHGTSASNSSKRIFLEFLTKNIIKNKRRYHFMLSTAIIFLNWSSLCQPSLYEEN